MRNRILVVAALFLGSTWRPPDLTASGGCIPGVDRVVAVAEPGAGDDVPDGGDGGAASSGADAGDAGAAAAAPPAAPPWRIRLAVRSGSARLGAGPVGRDDAFLSRLAASLGTRPLFEADPDVGGLAERLARSATRSSEGGGESNRTTGLEPFLVATVSLESPVAGGPVREPTYVVGLTLVVERSAADRALDVPPAVRWELDLPARAVRSDRLVGTVAQAIEARASVEIDRETAALRTALASIASGADARNVEDFAFRSGAVGYGELIEALHSPGAPQRDPAARSLARAADAGLAPLYESFLQDGSAAVRHAGLEGLWRLSQGKAPSLSSDDDRLPDPLVEWIRPTGETVCRFGEDLLLDRPPIEQRRAAIAPQIPAVVRLLGDPDPALAQGALVLLGDVGGEDEAGVVRSAMRLDLPDLALDALAVVLGRLGGDGAAPRLRAVASSGGPLADAAALALGRLHDRSADSVLLGMLSSAGDAVRCAAAEALSGTRSVSAPAALVPLLAGSNPTQVSRAAQAALVSLGRQAIPALVDALDSADPSIGWAAATALGQIGDQAAAPALRSRLVGLDSALRDYIVEALARIGDPRSIPDLISSFAGTEAGYANEAAVLQSILAFGRMSVPALVQALDSQDVSIRAGAIEALRRVGDRDHPTVVLPLLGDADPRVRARAARYLAETGDARAVTDLAALAGDGDDDVASAVAEALGAIGGPEARVALENALGDDRAKVVTAAARALAGIGNPGSVAPILEAAVDMSPFDRGRVVEALVAFGAAARAELIGALRDERLRPTALEALDGLGAAVPVADLERHRADARAVVRGAVATLLGRCGDPDAFDVLGELASDTVPSVREAAVAAIANLGGPQAAEVLRSVLEREKDEWVARAIRRALLRMGTVP